MSHHYLFQLLGRCFQIKSRAFLFCNFTVIFQFFFNTFAMLFSCLFRSRKAKLVLLKDNQSDRVTNERSEYMWQRTWKIRRQNVSFFSIDERTYTKCNQCNHCVFPKNAKLKKRRFLYVDSNLCRSLFIELWCHTNLFLCLFFFFFCRNSINKYCMLRVKSKKSRAERADNSKQQQKKTNAL